MRRSWLALASALVLALPAAAAPPSPPQVEGEPATLLIDLAGLPPGFREAGRGPGPGGAAAALFMRPAALGGADDSPARIMGLKARLSVHAGREEARAAMRGESPLTLETIRRDLGSVGAPGAGGILLRELEALSARVEEADELVGFRVAYRVEPLELVEYRFRLRVSNAVADLFVTGRASEEGVEPAALRAACLELVRLQADRLAAALR